MLQRSLQVAIDDRGVNIVTELLEPTGRSSETSELNSSIISISSYDMIERSLIGKREYQDIPYRVVCWKFATDTISCTLIY